MPDLRDFFSQFVDSLRNAEKSDPTFHSRFNNSPQHKRGIRCSPRTDLMLGTGTLRNGLLAEALQSFLGLDKQDPSLEVSYDRYMDFMASRGNWFKGERVALVTVEVENNLDEFRGTLSDLVRYQSRQKLGVFYDPDVTSADRRSKIEAEIRAVFSSFQEQGFLESEKTEYIIIFGQVQLAEGEGIGCWWAIRFTTGSLGSLCNCWLSGPVASRAARP